MIKTVIAGIALAAAIVAPNAASAHMRGHYRCAWMCEPHGYFYRHHHMRQMLPMRPMHHVMRPERPVSHPHPMH
jgi:hypothetical protein